MNLTDALTALCTVQLPKPVAVELAEGVTVHVAALPAVVTRLVDQALEHAGDPEPQAPMRRDDSAGSLAPPRPDLTDAAYARAFARWFRRRATLLALLAAGADGKGWATLGLTTSAPAEMAVELLRIEGEALKVLTERQLQALRDAHQRAEDQLVRAAAKN